MVDHELKWNLYETLLCELLALFSNSVKPSCCLWSTVELKEAILVCLHTFPEIFSGRSEVKPGIICWWSMTRFCGFEAPVANPVALISRPNDPWSVCNQLQPVRDVGWEEERCVLAYTSNPLVYNSSYGNTEVFFFCKTVANAVCFSLRDIWNGDWDEGWKPMVHHEAPGRRRRMKGLMRRGRLGPLQNLPFG